jgi:hypothetical protein
MESPEECRVWLIAFEAHCRGKKLADTPGAAHTTPQTDQFLERCGSKPLLKIISMLPDKDITKQSFASIKKAIEDYIEPRKRLIIADRTNFLQLTQNQGESVVDFLSRINDASVHCYWDSLATEGPNNELVKLRFIAGVRDDGLKLKILEKLQVQPSLTISEIIDFCQMNAQLSEFVTLTPMTTSNEGEEKQVDNFFVTQSPARNVQPFSWFQFKHS